MITVESTNSYDILTQQRTTSVFVKLHVTARTSGLIASLGPERWQTLCVLATFMDESGRCFPSEDQIAEALGVTRETACRRLKLLCEFRWGDRAIVTKAQVRRQGGAWANNVYTILPIAQLSIFDGEIEPCDAHVTPPCDVDAVPPCDADVTLTRTISNKIHKEQDTVQRSKEKIISEYKSPDIITYWREKYKERYGADYVVTNFAREGKNVKNKLLTPFGAPKVVAMIDYLLATYTPSEKWPRPTLAFLVFKANDLAALVGDVGVAPEPQSTASDAPPLDIEALAAANLL